MSKNSRRQFMANAGKIAAVAGLATISSTNVLAMPAKNAFVHQVYFWLKNPDSTEDLNKLIEGLKKLSKVKTIEMFHIGKPAGTSREVIDGSYSVSWLNTFKDRAAQDSYQVDPIHLEFIEECSPLWERVLVYDAVDI